MQTKIFWLNISLLLLQNFVKERKTRASYFPVYSLVFRRIDLRKETKVHCSGNFPFLSLHIINWKTTAVKCTKLNNARSKRAKLLVFIVKYANLGRYHRPGRHGYLNSL